MRAILGALCLLALAGCSGPGENKGDTGLAADNWSTPGGDTGKSHYSTLRDIDTGNVGQLGLAWQAELGTGRGLEATPRGDRRRHVHQRHRGPRLCL